LTHDISEASDRLTSLVLFGQWTRRAVGPRCAMWLVATRTSRHSVSLRHAGSGSASKSASHLVGPAYARGLATISRPFGSLALPVRQPQSPIT